MKSFSKKEADFAEFYGLTDREFELCRFAAKREAMLKRAVWALVFLAFVLAAIICIQNM